MVLRFGKVCALCGKTFWLMGGLQGICAACCFQKDEKYFSSICRGLCTQLGDEPWQMVLAALVGTSKEATRMMRSSSLMISLMGPTSVFCEWHGHRVSPFRALYAEVVVHHQHYEYRDHILDYLLRFVVQELEEPEQELIKVKELIKATC